MKKHQKKIAVNNQEDEDFEVYTLYPENAIAYRGKKKPAESYKLDSASKVPDIQKFYKPMNIIKNDTLSTD